MTAPRLSRILVGAAIALAATRPATQSVSAAPARSGDPVRSACGTAAHGRARCLAEYRTDTPRRMGADAVPDGYGPAELRAAYRLPATGGTGTMGIVDAYDYPTAEADLATYRARYGLPACTSASGCLRIVGQRGDATRRPAPNAGWSQESALDLQMASAACPSCRLLLVESDTALLTDLAAGVNTAVRLGSAVVSNSYGADENGGMRALAADYDHPGVPILVASGDTGFGTASAPAVFDSTIAVGGTSLTADDTARGWSESAWAGAASGCSGWIAKPAWQHDPNCAMRTVADVSAVADPMTGVAVYDSYVTDPDGYAGWLVMGGTSAAAPLVAGIIALAGDPSRVTPRRLYGEPAAFFDAVGGTTGYCGDDYLCTGQPGYDAPTGLGSPNGITPFQ